MKELDLALRRRADDGIVNAAIDDHRAHRLGAVGDGFGQRDDVGTNVETLCGESLASATESGNHFVEDEQHAVLVADRAQAFQITLGRYQHAGRAGNRLDEYGRDVLGTVVVDLAQQVVGEVDAAIRLPL